MAFGVGFEPTQAPLWASSGPLFGCCQPTKGRYTKFLSRLQVYYMLKHVLCQLVLAQIYCGKAVRYK